MAHYLIIGSYTSEAWAAQIKNPRNRVEAIRPMIEEHGGKIETAYYAFGDYDIFVILEFPDNVSAA
ncbi:MAG: GYD domain-containing protein, partial [SAR202 cluster bacterium]|nr:GYD domain-containing protein [SAR202 cluster bacterium]